MRLREWIDSQPRGARARLARATGLRYPTVHELYSETRRASYDTAKLISDATEGAVSVAELCEHRPVVVPFRGRPPVKRVRKRARSQASA